MSPREVLAKHWDGSLPVDLSVIASRVGVKIEHSFDEGASIISRIFHKTGEPPILQVNMTESPTRQRFAVAHQLGHYLLGHLAFGAEIVETKDSFSDGAADELERKANEFALDLLVPPQILRYLVFDKKITKTESLANIFHVSQALIASRLKAFHRSTTHH